jgi:predicted RNA binding protein YcfA (HicA-like mRNA interferase family)
MFDLVQIMKARELKKALLALGWWLKREGANHEI